MTKRAANFERPFPALTAAQRYHFDIHGYVAVERTLTDDQIGRMHQAMQQLKRDFLATGDPAHATVRGSRASYEPHKMHFAHILETDPAMLEYLAHPWLVGMAEEIVGGTVRLEESEALINRRDPTVDLDEPPQFGFHYGTRPEHGTYYENGLFHSNFVKTLTNLVELGPDDGGTVFIAGSHKVKCPTDDMIACAYEDPTLIHQVVAPAGTTVLFNEALIHATGQVRSDRERVILIGGYTPTMFQAWNGQEPSRQFVESVPTELRPLISGSDKWYGQRRYRTLDMPAQPSLREMATLPKSPTVRSQA